ncbi:MAG: glycosyltransferase [Alphaproteobacteria bacterium]|nr:glycosyltransferase [Alphaproteobacteria bacterium]
MHIVVASSMWAHDTHGVNAAPIVLHELTAALARQPGFEVSFLKVNRFDDPPINDAARAGITSLQAQGVRVLESLDLPWVARPRLRKYGPWPRIDFFHPEVKFYELLDARLQAASCDVVLVPMSEWLTPLAGRANVPLRYAYYGNPDGPSRFAQAELARRNGASVQSYLLARFLAARAASTHISEVKRYHLLGNHSANFAAYYRLKGHAGAHYARNTFIDRTAARCNEIGPSFREKRRDEAIAITCSIGKMFATANSYGFEILVRDLLPKLRKRFAGQPFELRLYGAGEPMQYVRQLLDQPELRQMGFVSDIDAALVSDDVFLCLNNLGPLNCAHTRYLHAWSLGASVVAPACAAEAIPEMVDGENALLGRDLDDIADMVVEAARKGPLRQKLSAQGYETFRAFFAPEQVARGITSAIQSYRGVNGAEAR